jgi:hypothetical protein
MSARPAVVTLYREVKPVSLGLTLFSEVENVVKKRFFLYVNSTIKSNVYH